MRRTACSLFLPHVPKGFSTDINHDSGVSNVTANFRYTEAAAVQSDREKELRSFFYLPRLDYDTGVGIPPLMSLKQFDIQYHWFHKDAVDRLNAHTLGTELEGHNLEVVIRQTAFDATRAVVHAAASEHFNYCFWYRSLRPWGTAVPQCILEELRLQYSRGDAVDAIEELKRLFTVIALSHEDRCGWVYLVWTGQNFDVVELKHGMCPVGCDLIPLMGLNLHESAMCVDYNVQTEPAKAIEQYVQNFFKTCNWILADRYFSMAIQRT